MQKHEEDEYISGVDVRGNQTASDEMPQSNMENNNGWEVTLEKH